MPEIQDLIALEILDSRGRPTVQTTCILRSGIRRLSGSSGRSTGSAEATSPRWRPEAVSGTGLSQGGTECRGEIRNALAGHSFAHQQELDNTLTQLDGSENKSRLGANAILSVSLAFARATAQEQNIPLYQYFANLLGKPLQTLPKPTINLLSGGHHAGWQIPIQDVLVIPASASTMDDALAMVYEVYQSASDLIFRKYHVRALSADEGGLAPEFADTEQMLQNAVESIELAGFKPGKEIALAIDVASSHFYVDGLYRMGDRKLPSEQMIEMYEHWIAQYPIVSLEDGLAEEDWQNWQVLHQRLGKQILVLGDDFLCTNPKRIQQAISRNAANALLLKVNQIGTLSEALQAYTLARSAGWLVTISARSGETEDHWLADLATGWNGDQIKIGSITQSERLAKYNRLLAIEQETGLPLNPWLHET